MNSKALFGCGRTLKNKSFLMQRKCSSHQKQAIRKVEDLNIPQRIERGPTDILEALSNTVSSKPLNLGYMIGAGMRVEETDPFFHKMVAKSQESGRNAAQWIVAKNPQHFQFKASEPYIDVFAPPPKLYNKSKVSEATLIKAIQSIQVEHSICIYKLLKKKNISISQSTKQQLLELTCYYNCSNKPNPTLLVAQYLEGTPKNEKWDKNGFHIQLFNEMEHNAESYSAVILGSAKYNSFAFGYNLFQEAESSGIKFGIEVYNVLLKELCIYEGSLNSAEDKIRSVLEQIERLNLKPNVETLEKSFMAILTMRKHLESKSFAMKVLKEFKRIGVQPSLGAYALLVSLFVPGSTSTTKLTKKSKDVVLEILRYAEDEMPPFQSILDYNFFPRMMSVAFATNDLYMAKKVDCLLMKGNNKVFLNQNLRQLMYYSYFLKTLFKLGDANDVSTYFVRVVNEWPIQSKVMMAILYVLDKRANGGAILQIVCEHYRGRFLENFGWDNALLVLELLEKKGAQMTNKFDLEVTKELWYTFQRFCLKRNLSLFRSKILGLFSKYNEKGLADEVFDKSLNLSDIEIDFTSLSPYFNICLKCGDKARAMKCAGHLCKFRDPNAKEVIKLIKSNFELDTDEWNTVNQLCENLKANTYSSPGS